LKNTGKPYEALTEQVFTRLLAQGSLCANVERDVVLTGKSTCHQIDVTFTFVAGPTTYRTIVQCKDWGTPVKQEHVLAFHGVLNDIPGQPRGIIVSRSGFQKGARNVAEHHGIQLYQLREPCDEDWDGLFRRIIINLTIQAPHFDEVRVLPDVDWIRKEADKLGLATLNVDMKLDAGQPSIENEFGAACDLKQILSAYLPSAANQPVRVRHLFTESTYVNAPECPIPRLRLLGVEATITVFEDHREVHADLDHLIAYAFRDVIGGSVQFLGQDGGPVKPE